MQSLQAKLMLWIGMAITALLVVAGLFIYWAVYDALLNQFDSTLNRTIHTLAYLIEIQDEQVESEMIEDEPPQFAARDNPDYYQIYDASGRSVETSSSLKGGSLPLTSHPGDGPFFEFLSLPDGRPGRMAVIQVIPRHEPRNVPVDSPESSHPVNSAVDERLAPRESTNPASATLEDPVTLVVARDVVDLNNTLGRIRWLIAIVTVTAILAGLLSAASVARIGLRPLRNAVAEISNIDGKHLDIRLNPGNAPNEVRPTILALNQMLDRLKETFQREREFSANVAHELRTPLAGIKSTIEVAISRKRDFDQYESSFNECLEICQETEAIIENLFTLARVDAGKCTVQREPVDLTPLIRECWKPFEVVAEQQGLSVSWNMDESIQVSTDPEKLRLVLRNLFDNATSYSTRESTIEVVCRRLGPPGSGGSQLQITNPSPMLKPNDIQHLFERFWRADPSRCQTGRHSGLGLPLCRSLIQLLGGQIEASYDRRRFTINVQLNERS